VATMSAVVLAHDDGKIGVAQLAPEHCLVLDPARPLFALLRLLELFEGPAVEVAACESGTRAPRGAAHKGGQGGQVSQALAAGVPCVCQMAPLSHIANARAPYALQTLRSVAQRSTRALHPGRAVPDAARRGLAAHSASLSPAADSHDTPVHGWRHWWFKACRTGDASLPTT